MKKIIILEDNDFIELPKNNQPIRDFKLKHFDPFKIEQETDVLVYNGYFLVNRYGNSNCEADLNKLMLESDNKAFQELIDEATKSLTTPKTYTKLTALSKMIFKI